MTEHIILTEGPKKEPIRKKSQETEWDLGSIRVGTSKLPIKETAGALDVSDQDLVVKNPTAANHPATNQQITDEASARASAVSGEALARSNADGVLQGNIDAEALARSDADSTLQDNIDDEELARSTADGILQGNIDAEALARSGADGILQGNIDAEALTRAGADSTLQSQLDAIAANNPDYKTVSSTSEGQTDFDFSPLTFDSSSLVFDVIITIDGRWQFPIENFLKLDDHTIRLEEGVPAGKQITAWKQGTSPEDQGGTDLQNINVNLGFVTPKTVGTLAKPAASVIVKDKANADVWEIEVNGGVLQAVK